MWPFVTRNRIIQLAKEHDVKVKITEDFTRASVHIILIGKKKNREQLIEHLEYLKPIESIFIYKEKRFNRKWNFSKVV